MRRRRTDWGVFVFLIALAVGNAAAFIRVDDVREQTLDRAERKLEAQTRQTARKLEAERVKADAGLRAATVKNCDRIHLLTVTLEDIVISARDSLRKYEAEGTITPAQLQRGLDDNARARDKLIGADCPPRSPLR